MVLLLGPVHQAPTLISDRDINRQNALTEAHKNVVFEPSLNGIALPSGIHVLQPKPDLLNRDHAEISGFLRRLP